MKRGVHTSISGLSEMGMVSMETCDVETVLFLMWGSMCLDVVWLSVMYQPTPPSDSQLVEATNHALSIYQATVHPQALSDLLLFLLLLWSGTWEPPQGFFSWKPTVLQASGLHYWIWPCRGAENRTTLWQALLYMHYWTINQYWKLNRESIGCVGVKKKKKKLVCCFGYSLGVSFVLAIQSHRRNATYPGSSSQKLPAIKKGFIGAN